VSVEHIFPQQPSEGWREQLGSEFEEMSNRKHTAANLSLSAFNSELSNSIFSIKVKFPEKGYRDSSLKIDKSLANEESWNLKALDRRFNMLLQRFFKIWNFPHHLRSDEPKDGRLNIFDVEDLTNKYLVSVHFFDKTRYKPNFKELLVFVSGEIYQLNPDIFTADFLRTKLKVTKNPSDLRTPIQIGGSYFIEGALSGRDILKRVKLILQSARVEEELQVVLGSVPYADVDYGEVCKG